MAASAWLALAVGGAYPALAMADTVATTGNATSVGTSSTELNGVIDPSYSDSAWFFEYGRTTDLSSGNTVTPVTPAGSGLHVVSALVNGLKPHTTYYFRVGVTWQADTTQGPGGRFGQIHSFTTPAKPPAIGRIVLTGGVVRLRGSVIPLRLGCRGQHRAVCDATVAVTAPRARGASLRCGTGTFVAYAGRRHKVRLHPSGACLKAIRRARGGRLGARLQLVVYPARTTLSRRLTLSA